MQLEYFQMVDRITALDPDNRRIQADCQVPESSPVFEGHFPGHPILPGVLMIETMAQAGGWLLMALMRFSHMPFLLQVEKAKLRAFVTPGQALQAEVALVHEGSGYAVVEGRLQSAGKPVAGADIRYRLAPFPNETLRGQMLETARRVAVPEEFLHG